jgi:Family of unknown function (DUF6527)
MTLVKRFDHEFVDQIPGELSEGILYVSMQFGTVIHLCACGCRNRTVTPLGTTDFKLIYDGETITLHPSVGNWNFSCRSHYLVSSSEIVWIGEWTGDQIAAFRARDHYLGGQPFRGHQADAGNDPADRHGPVAEGMPPFRRDPAEKDF